MSHIETTSSPFFSNGCSHRYLTVPVGGSRAFLHLSSSTEGVRLGFVKTSKITQTSKGVLLFLMWSGHTSDTDSNLKEPGRAGRYGKNIYHFFFVLAITPHIDQSRFWFFFLYQSQIKCVLLLLRFLKVDQMDLLSSLSSGIKSIISHSNSVTRP